MSKYVHGTNTTAQNEVTDTNSQVHLSTRLSSRSIPLVNQSMAKIYPFKVNSNDELDTDSDCEEDEDNTEDIVQCIDRLGQKNDLSILTIHLFANDQLCVGRMIVSFEV
jgi:hypothetical protein